MLLSIVIPAYNEIQNIERTILALREALKQAEWEPYELIVADDASTDGTAEIAEALGATIVPSGKRNIGATRNIGAAAARGEYILFLDADTLVDRRLMEGLKRAIEKGVAGGGSRLIWSEPVCDFLANLGMKSWVIVSRIFRIPSGSFFFVRREVFEKIGGFDEAYFISEEITLAKKLKRWGKVVILRETAATSPRKMRQFTRCEFARFVLSSLLHPRQIMRNRNYLDIWYKRRP
ncbi:MAG: glycosyltransferase [Candidatus Omnitrophota bacterium]